MASFKMANIGFRFFIELAALAAFGYWGFHLGGNLLMKLVLGLGAPLLMAVVWGLFLAPTARHRTTGAMYLALEIVIFGLATVCLALTDQVMAALVFGCCAAINTVLLHVWGDNDPVLLTALRGRGNQQKL